MSLLEITGAFVLLLIILLAALWAAGVFTIEVKWEKK